MKNVMVVNRKGKAVAVVPTGEPIMIEGVGSFVGIKAINACLKDIPVEAAGETVHFYIPDVLQGIIGGAATEYVKTGKTGTGTVLTEEEVNDFKEFYKLYAERILNVRFSLAKYAKDQTLVRLRTKAWNLLSQTNTVANTNTIIDPDKELREALGKKMLEAIDSGNMELYAVLKAERDKLKAPEVIVSNTAPKVEYDASKWEDKEDKATYITPSSRNMTVANTNTVVDDNNTDITEVPEEAEGNIAW